MIKDQETIPLNEECKNSSLITINDEDIGFYSKRHRGGSYNK